jgi:hypothetical protein
MPESELIKMLFAQNQELKLRLSKLESQSVDPSSAIAASPPSTASSAGRGSLGLTTFEPDGSSRQKYQGPLSQNNSRGGGSPRIPQPAQQSSNPFSFGASFTGDPRFSVNNHYNYHYHIDSKANTSESMTSVICGCCDSVIYGSASSCPRCGALI